MGWWARLTGRGAAAQIEGPREEASARGEALYAESSGALAAPAEGWGAGWVNPATGSGVYGVDAAVGAGYLPRPPLTEEEARRLWAGSWVAARVVEVVPADALAPGGRLDNGAGRDADADALAQAWEALPWSGQGREGEGAPGALLLAAALARCYGGALIALGLGDAASPDDHATPAREGAALAWLRVYHRWEVTPAAWGERGGVSVWRVTPRSDGLTRPQPYLLHASRAIRLLGPLSDAQTASDNSGWGDSALRRPWDALARYGLGAQDVSSALKDLGVYQVAILGLAHARGSEGDAAIARRLQLLTRAKGRHRAVLIDAERERADFASPSLAGVEHLRRDQAQELCAATGIPASRLFGTPPPGLSTDDRAGRESYHQLLSTHRAADLTPAARRIVAALAPAAGVTLTRGWRWIWGALGAPSEAEAVAADEARARATAALVAAGVPLALALEIWRGAAADLSADALARHGAPPLTGPDPSAIVSDQDTPGADSGQ
jgi:hypothetical protein